MRNYHVPTLFLVKSPENTRRHPGNHRSMNMLDDGGFDFWCDDLWGDYDDGTSAEENEYIRRMWEDDDEVEKELMTMRKRRNCGRRPVGTNRSGRPHYWASKWGVMLRDPELQTIGSDARKTFMRRFRVPHSIFTRLVDWTKGWHEGSRCLRSAQVPNRAQGSWMATYSRP